MWLADCPERALSPGREVQARMLPMVREVSRCMLAMVVVVVEMLSDGGSSVGISDSLPVVIRALSQWVVVVKVVTSGIGHCSGGKLSSVVAVVVR